MRNIVRYLVYGGLLAGMSFLQSCVTGGYSNFEEMSDGLDVDFDQRKNKEEEKKKSFDRALEIIKGDLGLGDPPLEPVNFEGIEKGIGGGTLKDYFREKDELFDLF